MKSIAYKTAAWLTTLTVPLVVVLALIEEAPVPGLVAVVLLFILAEWLHVKSEDAWLNENFSRRNYIGEALDNVRGNN